MQSSFKSYHNLIDKTAVSYHNLMDKTAVYLDAFKIQTLNCLFEFDKSVEKVGKTDKALFLHHNRELKI